MAVTTHGNGKIDPSQQHLRAYISKESEPVDLQPLSQDTVQRGLYVLGTSSLHHPHAPVSKKSDIGNVHPLGQDTIQRAFHAPGMLTPADVMALQRSIGNHAVQRLLRPRSLQPAQPATGDLTVQTKLTVGPAKDRYEAEADAVANQIGPAPSPVASPKQSHLLAKRIQRMSGAEGGKVDSATESAIQSARSGGQKLDDTLRSHMEGSFGADFSGVRIHSDPRADALNRSLNALAFTTGNDIFFKQGEFKPDRGSGQKLLAHELTHVVQQNGNGNVQRKSGVIQRAVGFEFEVGNWKLQKLNGKPSPAQKKGVEEIPAMYLADGDQVLGKESKIYQGHNYAMMADIGAHDTHVEFVTHPPFQETSSGRSTLVKTMKELHSLCETLIEARSKARVRLENDAEPKILASELPLTKSKIREPNVLITPRQTIDGEPQMTAGIRLEQVANVMKKMSLGALEGEDQSEAEQRSIGVQYLSGKQMRDAKLLSQSPGEVGGIVSHYHHMYINTSNNLTSQPSQQLIGMVSLLRTYLISAAGTLAYAKTLAPLMARTNYGEIFRHLDGKEIDFFRKYPDIWVDMVMGACGMRGEEDEPLFSGTSALDTEDFEKLAAGLSRRDWLIAMTQGRDLLTDKNFPDKRVGHVLFGLGGLGKKTDVVGKKRSGNKSTLTNAPIFEFRRMAGRKNFELWPTLAEELFDYIMGTNDLQNSTFSGARTEALDTELAKKKK